MFGIPLAILLIAVLVITAVKHRRRTKIFREYLDIYQHEGGLPYNLHATPAQVRKNDLARTVAALWVDMLYGH